MPKTILIVDDSATMRSVLRLYLQGTSFDFAEADNGESALRLARLLRPVLAIIDLHLPGMDGIELTQKLRTQQTPDQPRLPVIMLTADDTESGRQRAGEAGADEYLRKPINAGALRATVTALTTTKQAS